MLLAVPKRYEESAFVVEVSLDNWGQYWIFRASEESHDAFQQYPDRLGLPQCHRDLDGYVGGETQLDGPVARLKLKFLSNLE